jgi:hypothetical protein
VFIERPEQPEFEHFLDLWRASFEDEVRDPDEDMGRWLRSGSDYKEECPPCYDQFFIAQFDPAYNADRRAAGLIYASNYPTLQYLFISYIAVNEGWAEDLSRQNEKGMASEIRTYTARVLLPDLADNTLWERGVIAEIEKKPVKDNAERKRRFRYYAKNFFKRDLHQIGVRYLQPSQDRMNMRDIDELRENDLLLMPGPELEKKIEHVAYNAGSLRREDAIDLLEFVYMRMYAENFDEVYYAYIVKIFQFVCASLPDMVPLERIR